jgi:hypothetical protein
MVDETSRAGASKAGWIAAGVLVLIAAGAAVYASNLRNQLEDVELRLVDAVVKMQTAQQLQQNASAELRAIRENIGLVTAADVVELTLTGRPPAPEAVGRAYVSRSRGLLFAGARLPVPPEDAVLQLWYLTSGAPVSAGVVRPDEQGSVLAGFDVPADLPTLTGFAVTVEPEPGAAKPSGDYLLTTR